ncbi:hypothetical protein LBMAG52_22740 [Planctomycetia bacterium]|nr:hypothetical protein LBMAG52_22740 [Planctomycetia bacterium]
MESHVEMRDPRALRISDRQASLIALSEETRSTFLVAHSAARPAWRADRVELAICVNPESRGKSENSEGSDKYERLHGILVLSVPIRSNGGPDPTALTGGDVRVRAIK